MAITDMEPRPRGVREATGWRIRIAYEDRLTGGGILSRLSQATFDQYIESLKSEADHG